MLDEMGSLHHPSRPVPDSDLRSAEAADFGAGANDEYVLNDDMKMSISVFALE